MSIIARIAAVFALSLSLPNMIGMGPSMITPPVLISDSTFFWEGFSWRGLSEFEVRSKWGSLPDVYVLFEELCVDLDSWCRLKAMPIIISRNPMSIVRIPIEKSMLPSVNVLFSIGTNRVWRLLIQVPAYLLLFQEMSQKLSGLGRSLSVRRSGYLQDAV
jgi:hypothetical protein